MTDIREHDTRIGPAAALTPEEAREFHRLFVTSFIIFTLIAIVAHVLAWMWRPWLPGADGYAMVNDTVELASATMTAFLA